MSIAGIGTDLVEIARIEAAIARHGLRFGERILSADEYERWRNLDYSVKYLAKRFATKEAAAKALGTGFAQGVRWQDIETVHDAAGRPLLRFHGEAARCCERLGVYASQLSVSDERRYAVAFVVLLGRGKPS